MRETALDAVAVDVVIDAELRDPSTREVWFLVESDTGFPDVEPGRVRGRDLVDHVVVYAVD
ncbi:MAG: hypothetical protein P8R42_06785 [Candidatus Binatia bacterium]|nr:hypothetical protein [Candidatus Binatia bacterium]